MNEKKKRTIAFEIEKGKISPISKKEVMGKEFRNAAYVIFTEQNNIIVDTIENIKNNVPRSEVLQRLEDFYEQFAKSMAKQIIEMILPDEIESSEYNQYF